MGTEGSNPSVSATETRGIPRFFDVLRRRLPTSCPHLWARKLRFRAMSRAENCGIPRLYPIRWHETQGRQPSVSRTFASGMASTGWLFSLVGAPHFWSANVPGANGGGRRVGRTRRAPELIVCSTVSVCSRFSYREAVRYRLGGRFGSEPAPIAPRSYLEPIKPEVHGQRNARVAWSPPSMPRWRTMLPPLRCMSSRTW
jgi:hypothetical protein